ncbi:MAG: tetratricopeptide repeat protein [Candidatus Riflebacteria bacterium]|nr:tetratricopeptide repeat protein [Candidatus Riflebacteria bacterium]
MSNNHAVLSSFPARFIMVLALLASALVPPLSAQNLSLANNIYNQGIEHYADGDYRSAIDYLGQIVQMMPEHDQARYYLAYSHSLVGEHEKALEHARVLAARYPGHRLYLDLIAEFSQRMLGEQQQSVLLNEYSSQPAEPEYKVYTPPVSRPREMRRSKSAPRPLTLIERIAEMIEEERYEQASEELTKLIAAEPENAAAKYYLGMLHFNQGEFAAATDHFEASLKLKPDNFDACFFAGSSYLNRQMLAQAEKHFEQALKIKDDAFARINLADIYIRTSRPGESEQMYQSVIRANPDYTEAKVGLALVKLAQGLIEESAEIVNKVLSDNPSNTRARYVRSQILMENRLYSEALAEARAAYDGSPGNPEYRLNYALAMLRNFQVEPAMQEAQQILDVWPDFVEARLVLAEGMIMAGNTSAAVGHIEAAAAVAPSPQIDYLRATLAAAAGDHEQAKTHWKKYLDGAAGLPSAHLKYAMYLESVSDNAGALKAYEKIVEKFPESSLAEGIQADITRLSQAEIPPAVTPGPPIPGL